jgi:hypothetical protein
MCFFPKGAVHFMEKSENKYLIHNILYRYKFQNIYTVYPLLSALNWRDMDIFRGSKSECKSNSDKMLEVLFYASQTISLECC